MANPDDPRQRKLATNHGPIFHCQKLSGNEPTPIGGISFMEITTRNPLTPTNAEEARLAIEVAKGKDGQGDPCRRPKEPISTAEETTRILERDGGEILPGPYLAG
jgi:hypothetical protein